MKTYIYIIAVLIGFNAVNAQEIRYVNADNGLFLRETPNQGSKRVDKLVYGTALEVTERTNLKLDVKDDNTVISGEWVKVTCTDDLYNNRTGYVFNGFLTDRKLEKRFSIDFEDFKIEFNNLRAEIIGDPQVAVHDASTVDAFIDFGETLKNKTIRIRHHSKYKDVKVFQKYESSIAIHGDASYCHLEDWKHFYSAWEPLKTKHKNSVFKTVSYDNKSVNQFVEVDINAFKDKVKGHCGEDWVSHIKDNNTINEGAAKIVMSKMYFKVIFTTLENKKVEKIIAFDMPI
ncbi:SH3 domain-containing protein [Hyunsoonleella ulvae]|uniref:SH3 domain-containing protein n=2 Tax=Flavobacteriaceae TaxID=49546 RepID=UPI00193AACB5|nr:SH3 domain-containing protein [Hyunsoonleella ulvae]